MDEEFQLRVSESLGRIEQKVDGMREELLGDGGRVTNLEDELDKQKNRQWLHSAILLPAFSIIHRIANNIGWRI